MFNGLKISKLLEERGATKVSLFTHIGISKKGLDDIINGVHAPRVTYIEAMADFFKVPIDYFFDRDIDASGINIGHQVKGNGNKVSGDIALSECRKEIEHLNALLEERERVIGEKERTIQILLNKN